MEEIGECKIDASRLAIDGQAMIISNADRDQEERLKKEIGSTGQGVGAATSRRIMGVAPTRPSSPVTSQT
jgi:adenylosuccinate synthase